MPLYKKSQAKLDKVLLSTRENLTGARVLRAFCKEEDERAQFSERNGDLTKSQKFVGGISALMNPLTYVILNAAIIALIYVGGVRVNLGHLSQGKVLALYNLMTQILVELIKLANLIVTVTKSAACGSRIESVLDMKSSLELFSGGEKGTSDGANEEEKTSVAAPWGAAIPLKPKAAPKRTPRSSVFDRVSMRYKRGRGKFAYGYRFFLAARGNGGRHRRHGIGKDDARQSRSAFLRRDGRERQSGGQGRARL